LFNSWPFEGAESNEEGVMGRFELDKWDVGRLYEQWKKVRLNVRPDYQRSKVWPDRMKYDLVETVLHDWPMGLIMINVVPHVDPDNPPVEYYEVVDGQQRLATLFEYKDGDEQWVNKTPPKGVDFKPYGKLAPAFQDAFDEYRVSVAIMRDFEQDEILDIYSRLQNSKPLKMGEKVKALRSDFKPQIRDLTEHKIFGLGAGRHRVRDGHWNLAAVFFKAVYKASPLDRQEYPFLEEFLRREPYDAARAKKAAENTAKLLNIEYRLAEEASEIDPGFDNNLASARLLKWAFVSLGLLSGRYALAGREHLLAEGVLSYYRARDQEGTDEWAAYLNTGRTGRIDTDDVRACLEQLMNRMIAASEAPPLDGKRFFSPEQRTQIFQRSEGKCALCKMKLSLTNFHADHIVPYRHGGKTTVENGQALCTACNRKKGGNPELFG
jgi:hypothetical protein